MDILEANCPGQLQRTQCPQLTQDCVGVDQQHLSAGARGSVLRFFHDGDSADTDNVLRRQPDDVELVMDSLNPEEIVPPTNGELHYFDTMIALDSFSRWVGGERKLTPAAKLEVFQTLMDRIRKLYESPEIFQDEEEYRDFFQVIGRVLRLVKRISNWKVAKTTYLKRFEENENKTRPYLQVQAPLKCPGSTWSEWCRNTTPSPTLNILQEAQRKGSLVPRSTVWLPRGGLFVLERWLREGKEFVNALLQVSLTTCLNPSISILTPF